MCCIIVYLLFYVLIHCLWLIEQKERGGGEKHSNVITIL